MEIPMILARMKTSVLVVMIMAACGFFCQAEAQIKIGVLAKDGPAQAMKQWGATGEYLTGKLGEPVEIVPLGFDQVFPAIEAGNVHFFLVNSSMFITAKLKYGSVPVATMINSRQGKSLNAFGGVIFTSAYNDAISSFADIKGKKFGAVEKASFGGWQMAYKEFLDAGIDPFKDFASVEFFDKHENVVFAVQNEQVAAGTVRTDTLERMAASGAISMDDFKIIGKKDLKEFPFVCSTALYPEWPLAKVAATDDTMVSKVVTALKELKPEDKAAIAAKVVGWSDPLDYTGIEELQKTLKIGAFAE